MITDVARLIVINASCGRSHDFVMRTSVHSSEGFDVNFNRDCSLEHP